MSGYAMVEGLSHITFIIRDLDRMARILTGGLSVEGEGRSLYFYDDNHLFEQHTGALEERLRRYAR